jgi:hypothetical protein
MLGPDLPDHDDLRRAPELAHLAMVHTAASLAWQALLLENPELHDLCPPELFAGRPSLLLASVLVTRLDELTELIAAYKASLLAVDLSAAISTPFDDHF